MVSRVIGFVLGVGAVGALVGALMFGLQPEAQEPVPAEDDVSASEIQMYIDVYGEMQGDHAVTLDQALAKRSMPLGEFRSLERRIQRQDRLVRKVREALLAQAKARGEQLPAVAAKPVPPAATP